MLEKKEEANDKIPKKKVQKGSLHKLRRLTSFVFKETQNMAKDLRNSPLVWNKPVDPAADKDFNKRSIKPVTLEKLGGNYLTAGLRHFPIRDGKIDLKELRRDLNRWHNPSLKIGETSPDLMSHNFGKALWLNINFLRATNWKKAIEEIKRRKLYIFDCWGVIPGCKEADKGGFFWVIPDDVHSYLTSNLGKYFLGWDNGENDGRWFWQSMRIYPALVSRKEVYQYFLGWFQPFISDLKKYVTAGNCGLTYPHYFAKMDGHRMIGAEFLQALPSVPMWAAWIRGAARQYQILWTAGTSIFNMFGYKTFEDDGFLGDSAGKEWMGLGNPQVQGGPDRGQSMSLIKRVWYLLFMYGVNIEALEASQFFRPAGPVQSSILSVDREKEGNIALEAKEEYLSPLGKMQLQVTSFCVKNTKRRGMQYCPVGVLLDFYSGWAPPRHFYSDSFYTVWGGIPYEKGDHQIDLFFREIYPGYQDCAYFRNERGFLTSTPYGDIIDVLLSDARDEILSRYRVISVLGEISVKDKLLAKLVRYVKKGGNLIWSLCQLDGEAIRLSGITSRLKKTECKESYSVKSDKRYEEPPFAFPEVNLSGCRVLLKSKNGQPLMVNKAFGKGEIMTIIVPFGLSKRREESHPLIGADPLRDTTTISYFDKPIGSPYQFLKGIKEILFPYLDSFNLIEVISSKDPLKDDRVGRPAFIQYITNLTERPDKLVVTLVNNEPLPIYVLVKVKGAKIKKAIDLLHQKREISPNNGQLLITLFPSDSTDFNIYIVELKLDRPIVRFMEMK